MPQSPYDELIRSPGSQVKKTRRSWLSQEESCEEWHVEYLLDRYGLAANKTRFCLIDQENEGRPSSEHRTSLTLAAFNDFFPEFPVDLFSFQLSKREVLGITLPKLLRSMINLPLFTQIFTLAEEIRDAPIACIIDLPHVSIEDSPVIHTWLPMNINIPGPHMYWTLSENVRVGVETLGALMHGVDAECPKEKWLKTARRSDFCDAVEKKG
jgi:hypothetical protein